MTTATTTIKDVARKSGVNVSTVSRLNGTYGVKKQTRDHVKQIAEQLGYRPNRVAGAGHRPLAIAGADCQQHSQSLLRRGRARGAEDAAQQAGMDLILCNSDLDPEKQMHYVHSLLDKRVDGIMMYSVSSLNRIDQERLAAANVPIVLLNRSAPKHAFSTVCANNEMGGELAANYLLKLGHRKIAHLGSPKHNYSLVDRARGFATVLQHASPSITPIIMHGKNSFAGGQEQAAKLLKEHPDVTAIFTANDAMAFGAMRAIIDAGLKVPDDISLIGFDNVELSSIMHPPLTTIHQPKHEMGRAAVEILLRLGNSGERRVLEHRLFEVELVERQSCRKVDG